MARQGGGGHRSFPRFRRSDEQRRLFMEAVPKKCESESRSFHLVHQTRGLSIIFVFQHPSRTVSAYASYHWKRREFLDARVAAIKAANNGQPIVYQHPEVVGEDSEVEKLSEEEGDASV